MLIKAVMVFSFIFSSIVSSVGKTEIPTEIRVQYVHHHDSSEHTTENDHESHDEKHTHELIICSVFSNFIQVSSQNMISFDQSDVSYPKIQNERLPLSGYPGSIFRPPIRS